MRHFIAYHNSQKMGYSFTTISTPNVKTSKAVIGLEGSMVWLIAGEGACPKSYYIAAEFVIDTCETSRYSGTKLSNEVSGAGTLFGKRIHLNGKALLAELRRVSKNFRSGFFEVKDTGIIANLRSYTSFEK